MKVFSCDDVIKNIKDNEVYKSTLKTSPIQEIKKEYGSIVYILNDDYHKVVLSGEFIKIEKEKVITSEAFNAYEKGCIIGSVVSGDIYKKGETSMMIKRRRDNTFIDCPVISTGELSGLWYIY